MKTKVNRNILWAEVFVKNLLKAGVKYVCISPGSRSTPLTYAFASEPGIKSYVHIDERSAAFFATGLARKTGTPVALLCTSGTAVAEYYPGIIEAYQQRIPLIVCTADRPTGSYKKGLNQTINQDNIFKNHIRWFIDAGMPDPYNLNWIENIALRAVSESLIQKGPVHINFPFDKPFEPDNYTDEIETSYTPQEPEENSSIINISRERIEITADTIISEEKGLIAVGPGNFSASLKKEIIQLSSLTGYPVLADGASQLRSGAEGWKEIITNYDALFRSGFFSANKPALILHFGRTMTSKGYEDYLKKNKSVRFLVNNFGDIFDSGDEITVIEADEEFFIRNLIDIFKERGANRSSSEWFTNIVKAETIICEIKKNFINTLPFPDELRVITEVINLLPAKCNLMLSNSSPVRDFGYFSGHLPGEVKIYHNRGASGIDGIISTALGIAATGEQTVLLTGDLAFYHDMNGLLTSAQYNIPLVIILINNNGGGIFSTLPVSGYKEIFNKYFTTPHNLAFKPFVEGYGGIYKRISGWDDLAKSFESALKNKNLTVLEIITDADQALANRKKYWTEIKDKLNDNFTY